MSVLSLGAISVVDDDESVRTSTEALLRSIGYEVKTFASAELFLESGALGETECLVLDVQMPGIDGLELQRRLNEARSGVPIIFITATEKRTHRQRAIEAGAVDFFRKPLDAKAFLAAIQSVLRPSPTTIGRFSEETNREWLHAVHIETQLTPDRKRRRKG
jgi:FixJ family two-component response regulator